MAEKSRWKSSDIRRWRKRDAAAAVKYIEAVAVAAVVDVTTAEDDEAALTEVPRRR